MSLGLLPQLILERLGRCPRVQTPQVGSLAKLHLFAVYVQCHGALGAAADEQRLNPCGSQLSAKVTPDVGAAQEAGERGDRADLEPRG